MTQMLDEASSDDRRWNPDNPPGLKVIAYRSGAHTAIFYRLLAHLHTQTLPGHEAAPPLRDLATRDRDDPAIALLDAWAMVADIITFYQERIANEGYLRTALEERSVLELARAIGYEFSPGVAATVPLVFTVEDAPGSEPVVTVPQGTKVQSVPSLPGETPQTFETIAAFQARVEWNCLNLYYAETSKLQTVTSATTTLRLVGTNTRLQVGDRILLMLSEQKADGLKRCSYWLELTSVEPNTQRNETTIRWASAAAFEEVIDPTVQPPQVFTFRQQASLFGHNAPAWNTLPLEIKQKYLTFQAGGTTISSNGTSITVPAAANLPINAGDIIKVNQIRAVLALSPDKKTATLDGSFEPALDEAAFVYANDQREWSNLSLNASHIDLDTVYPNPGSGNWIIVQASPTTTKLHVESVSTTFRTDYELSGKVTRLTFKNEAKIELDATQLRQTTVYMQGEPLAITMDVAPQPTTQTQELNLPATSPPFSLGQPLIISGLLKSSPKPETMSELAIVAGFDPGIDYATLKLQTRLIHDYDQATVKVYGNVMLATHGETVEEILGSGDGSRVHQRFTLKKAPLTYVAAATERGNQSTLQIYVNDVQWEAVISLHDQSPTRQCYITQQNTAGQTIVIFGDGLRGARLPSGQENIRAIYRSGLGLVGHVKAGSIILLQNRPLGIRDVTNLLAASGAADRDTVERTRESAPRTVQTLDHVVSLRDYENFAQTFAGVGKAQAVRLWLGTTQGIHITIAAADGKVAATSLCDTLRRAIAAVGNPLQAVEVTPYVEGRFKLDAIVRFDRRHVRERVESQIIGRLRAAFSFKQREFGQGVAATDVIEVMQSTEGVVAVDLNQLYRSSNNPTDTPKFAPFLEAYPAHYQGSLVAAELLQIDGSDDGIQLQLEVA
jgi:predicted phage baseplate assembly protein